MLKAIANNAEIDVIWDEFQAKLEPLRNQLNSVLGQTWEEWEISREAGAEWSDEARQAHIDWWEQRIARQMKIDASIAAKADFQYLYDKPYNDNTKIRVAGPFTVESLSPHRTLAVDHDDELVDTLDAAKGDRDAPGVEIDFATMVMENLRTSGVQQMEKGDRISFSSLTPWPGRFIAAEGRYQEGEDGPERRAGIFIGPEFGTVQRADLTAAARECAEAGFDILVACAFSYSAQCTDLTRMGAMQILRARMNPDLHMADDLKNTGTGNLFVVFGEPDIEIIPEGDQIRVKIHGVDVFKPQTGEIESSGPDGIACWFIDTDYNEESFFVRHAYFLGANDPYKALKTTLRAEIDAEAWESLHSDVSRPFDKPKTGRIAVKVINHLGDEVMKVFGV
jgi:adenine-specific DNA-methyltransferase